MDDSIRGTDATEAGGAVLVSLKTLAGQLDADRSTVRRWLRDAGISPVVVGRGRNAAIRFDAHAVRAWLQSRQRIA